MKFNVVLGLVATVGIMSTGVISMPVAVHESSLVVRADESQAGDESQAADSGYGGHGGGRGGYGGGRGGYGGGHGYGGGRGGYGGGHGGYDGGRGGYGGGRGGYGGGDYCDCDEDDLICIRICLNL